MQLANYIGKVKIDWGNHSVFMYGVNNPGQLPIRMALRPTMHV